MVRLALVRDSPESLHPSRVEPAVLVVDDRRRCVEANAAAINLLGIGRQEIVGARIDRLLSPAMRDRLEGYWRAFRNGGGHAGPFDLATPGLCTSVDISLTRDLIPGRHLIVISPAGRATQTETGAGGEGVAREGVLRRATPEPVPTPRELEVLALLAGGSTDPQIAELLGRSPATVQTHVRNAKARLGARTRTQAVALALDRGLIELPVR